MVCFKQAKRVRIMLVRGHENHDDVCDGCIVKTVNIIGNQCPLCKKPWVQENYVDRISYVEYDAELKPYVALGNNGIACLNLWNALENSDMTWSSTDITPRWLMYARPRQVYFAGPAKSIMSALLWTNTYFPALILWWYLCGESNTLEFLWNLLHCLCIRGLLCLHVEMMPTLFIQELRKDHVCVSLAENDDIPFLPTCLMFVYSVVSLFMVSMYMAVMFHLSFYVSYHYAAFLPYGIQSGLLMFSACSHIPDND